MHTQIKRVKAPCQYQLFSSLAPGVGGQNHVRNCISGVNTPTTSEIASVAKKKHTHTRLWVCIMLIGNAHCKDFERREEQERKKPLGGNNLC